MEIDFHCWKDQMSYANRLADTTWKPAIEELLPFGGYSKTLVDIGINSVTDVDFSKAILDGAKQNCKDYKNISFVYGNAVDTNLASDNYDFLIERALISHIEDLNSCISEVVRLLKENGVYIIQDRTPEDCLLEGNENHIKGYFFELFPRLTEKEMNRRYKSNVAIEKLQAAGFKEIEEVKLWETRTTYNTKEQILRDFGQ